MKFARLMAGLSGALALMTINVARAEVVTFAPDGTVERSENAQAMQTQSQSQSQSVPQHNLATPEAAAGMRYGRGPNDPGRQIEPRNNDRRDRDDRDNRDRNDRDRDNRHDRDRYRYYRPGGGSYYGGNGSVVIIGDNTDVYYYGGRPGYGYGYPAYGYWPYGGYPDYNAGYGYPGYGYYGGTYGNYGGTYSNGGSTVIYGRGSTTIIGGQAGMGPAFPNMQPAPGMGSPFATVPAPPRIPQIPRAVREPGRRR